MKKLLFSLMILFLIVGVQATTPISSLPTTISLNCGDTYYEIFSLSGTNNTIYPITLSSSLGYQMGITQTYTTGLSPNYPLTLHLSLFETSACSSGNSTFTFSLNGVTKSIVLTTTEDLWNLGTVSVGKGKKIDVGNIAHLGILEISDTRVQYILSGCGTTQQGLLNEDETLEAVCSEEDVQITLKNSYGDPFNFAEFEIYSSEAGLILTSSNDTIEEDSECVLGIDTLGATVKRGSVFAFNTINANSGKYEQNVIVNVLDQAGDLTPLSGTSDNTGFFSKRIHEDYKQDLLIKLFKEGCEPTNKVILFEESYDDYIKTKQEEEGEFQLQLNMSDKYEMKAISGTIKNALNNVVEGVDVKITKPDNSIITVKSNTNGLFTFTPAVIGTYKIQGGKDNYKSTELISINVYQSKQYLVVIKVDGKQRSEYKEGDILSFELRGENNTLIPLSIDATFAGLPLRFISGISDKVTFTSTSILAIPATEGYLSQSITLVKKENDWASILYWIGIIVGIFALVIISLLIIKKLKTSTNKNQEMQIQLGQVGGGD